MPHPIWAQGTKARVLNNILHVFRYDAETDANCRVLTLEGTFDLTLNCQNLTVNFDFPLISMDFEATFCIIRNMVSHKIL